MALLDTIRNTLANTGINAFGLGMPTLSPDWTSGALPTVDETNLALTSSANWVSPLTVQINRVGGANPAIDVTLIRANGSVITESGLLLTLYPQAYLRLRRLFSTVIEGRSSSDPLLNVRPVPRYFFIGSTSSADISHADSGDDLGVSGTLTVHDADGMPIDPLFVAGVFRVLMAKHSPLQKRDLSATFEPNSQVKQIADLAGTTAATRIRFSTPTGAAYDGAHLNGITAVNAAIGLFTLNAPSAGGTASITRESGTGTSGIFPNEEARLLVFGAATTGRLRSSFAPSSLASDLTLIRDFFSVRVVSLKLYLLGEPNFDFIGTQAELPPTIRIHEPLMLLADGNDVLGAANGALSGTLTESLCVAQAIDGNFPAPTQSGINAHWAAFPPLPAGTTAAPAGNLPIDLRDSFSPSAQFFDDGNSATPNLDVVLRLSGLPAGAAVRVYSRKFIEDAREARGDGAGSTIDNSGILQILLQDPFGLIHPGIPAPTLTEATLRCDVMVVKRTGEARLYGNVETLVTGTTTIDPTPLTTNNFGTATRRGISNAGVLGLGTRSLSPIPAGMPTDEAFLRAIGELTGETNPRDASRFPTMARRDLLVAGLSGGNWRSTLSAGRLTPEAHSAQPRLGAPGSRGGRETQLIGITTQNARLAYDIARTAFRRTTNVITRLTGLTNDNWNEPAQPTELAANATPTQSQGTFAGAVLQTIAPFCETPELRLLKSVVESNLSSVPPTFDEFVDWVAARINDIASQSSITGNTLLNEIVNGSNGLQQRLVNELNNLKDDDTLSESKKERLYDELRRALMASCFGRRDAQWALEGAIAQARRFIYIETPGFCSTQKDYGGSPVPAYAADLISTLSARLTIAPGLHVIICVPKYADFAVGYESLAAREVSDRRIKILALPADRVVSFHPVGFPGRQSRLESTVVIIDDVWAMVGSSTFRRRGLTFDGGSDLVFTDTDFVDSRSPAIASFRRTLMAQRLGTKLPDLNVDPLTTPLDPTFTRLNDGVEAFYAIRELLLGGGLGKIERLWNGRDLDTAEITPASTDLANPDGQEFNLLESLTLSIIASQIAF